MPEYSFLAILSFVLVLALDFLLSQRLILKTKFWIFIAISFFLQLVADGFLTARPIYVVNPQKIWGLYLFTIPVENLIFGVSMLYLSVIVFESLTNPPLDSSIQL